MTIIRMLHFLVTNLKENVNIVVNSKIKQRISRRNFIKMAIITAEIITVFRKIRVLALNALIAVDQGILKVNVTI
jgi:hypothetical protein